MVQIRYKGQNYLIVGKYRFNNGYTEVKDEDFYEMMKSPTFAYRVNQRILEVPKGFPIEKPEAESVKKSKEIKDSSDSKATSDKEVAKDSTKDAAKAGSNVASTAKDALAQENAVAADSKDVDSNKNKK